LPRNLAEKLLQWAFALLSIVIVWQLNLPRLLKHLAATLGAADKGWVQRIIIDGGVPVMIAGVAALSLWLYRAFIWRLSSGSLYQGGWWVYALVSERAEYGRRRANSVGFFRVVHTTQEARVVEGCAYYVENNSFERGRYWHADTMWVSLNHIRLVFSMRATDPLPEVLPSHFEGFMELNRVTRKPLVGKTVWSGYFNDLKDRRDVFGSVYAERLTRFVPRKAEDVENLLYESFDELLKRVRS
jgi:hypothetical protein